MNIGCKQYKSLSYSAQNHGYDEYRPSSICVRVRWQDEEPDKHANHIAGAYQPYILRWFAEQIELLYPIIDVLGVSLIVSEQVLVQV